MSGVIAQNLNRHSGLIKAPEGGGAWNFISKVTASASADISFTSGIDSTYREYLFYFVNIHPGTTSKYFTFNGSIDSGSNYNIAKTTYVYGAYNSEADDNALTQDSGSDLAQGTGYQRLTTHGTMGTDNDMSGCGFLHLFNPGDTTFVKHFIARFGFSGVEDYMTDTHVAGYLNTTSAIDAIQFKMSGGNIDSGDIFLHGLTT